MKMRLKAIFYYWLQIIILSAGSLIFPACQKVINVDLNEAAPKIVIEGLITDKHGPYMLTLSKSGSYFNQPVLQTVTGAQVTITDDKDNVDSLKETAPGVYLTLNTKGFPGIKYTLKVIAENQEYDASSTMPSHVNIDSLRVFKSDAQRINFGGKPRNNPRVEIHCFFKDPLEKNFYRIKVFKNDSISTDNYRLFDDQYTNGEYTEIRVAFASAAANYRVELLSLDKSTYGYYRTLEDLLNTNPFFGSTPANPDTDLSNGALGYFGACAVSTKSIVVTDSMINAAQ
jgi:hypothetical protein